MPVCWNWQTRWTQNPLVAIPCGFDPRHRHQRGRPRGQPLPAPLERGGLTFVQNPSDYLEAQASKVFYPDTAQPPRRTLPAPLKNANQ